MVSRSSSNSQSQTESQTAIDPQGAESEAIRRAQQGDDGGFDRLYLLYCKRVYSLCLRMLTNPNDAEDLTQEVFVQVLRKLRTFRAESQFSTWLHRVTVNAVLMHFRRHKSLSCSPANQDNREGEDGISPPEALPGRPPAAQAIERIHLRRAISQLPSQWRAVVLLHDVQGYKHTEIAQLMNCSVSSSKGHLHRAHARLRRALTQARRPRAYIAG